MLHQLSADRNYMMMTDDERLFIDTNILVYANMVRSQFHLQAQERLQSLHFLFDELWISVQTVREFLAVKSRITYEQGVYNADELVLDVKEFESNYPIASNDLSGQNELLRLIAKYKVKGKQVHDCNIIATMISYKIKVYSLIMHQISSDMKMKEYKSSPSDRVGSKVST